MAEVGFIGLEEFKENLMRVTGVLSGKGLRDALYAGAEVFRSAIQAAAPIGKEYYTYQYKGRMVRVKSKHRPGQAKGNIIIYERKRRGALMTQAGELSLLVGPQKKKGFYLFWYEYGRKGQAAHPFMRSAFDSARERALEAARESLATTLKGAV